MNQIPAGLHEVASSFGACHVLVDEGAVVVIDSGLFGMPRRFRDLFDTLRLSPRRVGAVILTHGHLDHAGNANWLRAWTGAPILAHPADQTHLAGCHPYRGWSRVCGGLEAVGRRLIHYRPVHIDQPIHDGDELPWWGGLQVIELPGHTQGHCGLWSERHRLLFCGDLVAIWRGWTQFPPAHLNTESWKLRASLRRAAELRPQLVVPNHYSRRAGFDPAYFAKRFRQFAERKLGNSIETGQSP